MALQGRAAVGKVLAFLQTLLVRKTRIVALLSGARVVRLSRKEHARRVLLNVEIRDAKHVATMRAK